MSKKDTFVPILVITLSIAFSVIALAVFLSKGKSKFWLSRKMKLGALLLTLTAVSQQSCAPVSCYDPIEPNQFNIDNNGSSGINIDLNVDSKIYGSINEREGTTFSYNITDSLQTENIIPTDGVFDSSTESFIIDVDTNIVTGNYYLQLYKTSQDNQTDSYNHSYKLNITNED